MNTKHLGNTLIRNLALLVLPCVFLLFPVVDSEAQIGSSGSASGAGLLPGGGLGGALGAALGASSGPAAPGPAAPGPAAPAAPSSWAPPSTSGSYTSGPAGYPAPAAGYPGAAPGYAPSGPSYAAPAPGVPGYSGAPSGYVGAAPGVVGAPSPYGGTAPGYAAPAPGYAAPAPGYGASAPGYAAPAPAIVGAPSPYGGTVPGFAAPNPGYAAPAPATVGAPSPYGGTAPGYAAPAPGYAAPAPGAYGPATGYGAAAPAYGSTVPSYPAPGPGYSLPSTGYTTAAPGYSAPGYSAPGSMAPAVGAPVAGYPGGAPVPGMAGAAPMSISPSLSGGILGAGNTLSSGSTLNSVVQALGMAPGAQSLGGLGTAGGLSDSQLQDLTARLGAMNFGPSDVSSIANALGLSSGQVSQIMQNLQASKSAQPGMPNPTNPSMTSNPAVTNSPGVSSPPPVAAGFGAPSPIEVAYQQYNNPSAAAAPPPMVTQFGYNFLAGPVTTFAPIMNVPVGDDYIVGPGDQLDVMLWGRVNNTLQLLIGVDGSIQIPQVGPVQVAGLNFGQAKKLIEDRLEKIQGTNAQVTMGQLRTIQVFVVGEAIQPGVYTVSALSRISNALNAAGGVSKTGSLRKIQLRRGNSVHKTIDLYQFLLFGDNSADERLQNNDVIFIPVIGSVVGVVGDLKRPAIFELSSETDSLNSVIDKLAGGVTAFGYTERLQVERVENHKRMLVLDVPLPQLKSQETTKLRDGDLVTVLPVLPVKANTVVLSGNVYRPGEYQLKEKMRVSQLIREGQGVLPHTYFKYALIKRLEGPQRYTHFVQVNLAAALSGDQKADLELTPHDELDIYSLDALRDMPQVVIGGSVRAPGTYVMSERMKISDLIYLAGGLREDAYTTKANLLRLNIVNGKAQRATIDLNLAEILNGTSKTDLVLKAYDEVQIWSVLGWQEPSRTVLVSGEVLSPGPFAYTQGMRVRDLFSMAGGFKDDADRKTVQLARTQVTDGFRTTHYLRDLDLRAGSPDYEYQLSFDDQIFVAKAPNYHLPKVVNITGEVMSPGHYVIRDQERLSSVLDRSGGFLPTAFPKGMIFTRADVQQEEQVQLDAARQRLQQELLQLSIAAPIIGAASGGGGSTDSSGLIQNFSSLQALLTTSQGAQADGRIVLHGEKIGGMGYDIRLQDGDAVIVPKVPSSVFVLGQVYQPTSLIARNNLSLRDYLYEAGGPTPQGDLSRVYLVRADGSVITQDSLDNGGRNSYFPAAFLIGNNMMSQRVDAGDTIYVPENLADIESQIRLKYTKDIFSIVANVATTLGIVGLLATKL